LFKVDKVLGLQHNARRHLGYLSPYKVADIGDHKISDWTLCIGTSEFYTCLPWNVDILDPASSAS